MRYSKVLIFTILLAGMLSGITAAQVEDAPKEIQAFVDREGKKENVPTEINKLVYGDVNGDKVKDAVVQYNILVAFPGNNFVSYIAVFLNRNGKYVFAAQMANGGKHMTVLVPRTVTNRVIVFDKYSEDGFKKIGTARYRLAGRRLVKV